MPCQIEQVVTTLYQSKNKMLKSFSCISVDDGRSCTEVLIKFRIFELKVFESWVWVEVDSGTWNAVVLISVSFCHCNVHSAVKCMCC